MSDFLAGELVLGGELVDLVFVAEPLDQRDQVAGEGRLVVAGGVPEPFELAQLLRLDDAIKHLAEFFGRLHLGGLRVERRVGLLADGARFVAGEDLAFALKQHGNERVDAGAEA